MDPVLIPPGRTLLWKCPNGLAPSVQKGQILKLQDKPALYIADVTANGLVLGPMMAGEIEISGLCGPESKTLFRIEVPDPSKVDKNVQLLSPVPMTYPVWLWVVLVLGFVVIAALTWFVRRKLLSSPEDARNKSRGRLQKTPLQKMELFLSRISTEQLVDKGDAPSSQTLYGDGLSNLRLLLQEAYGFKAMGATTTEFIAEIKAQALRKPSIIAPPQLAQLESTFMQAKQVTYAREIPDLPSRKAYLKSLQDFTTHLGSKISAAQLKPKEKKSP